MSNSNLHTCEKSAPGGRREGKCAECERIKEHRKMVNAFDAVLPSNQTLEETTRDMNRDLLKQVNDLKAEIAILKETHENQMDIIEKLHECRDVRRFEAIQMEIDGYLDGAPDASAASKLAGRISAILKPMDAPYEPSNRKKLSHPEPVI